MTETDLLLTLTGVTRFCSDCDGDRIFVEPEAADGEAAPAEYACTDCGAGLFIDPLLFTLATPVAEVRRRVG
jgi:hypothetical protein